VSANAYATGSYQCPSWQPWWISEPPSPSSLYSTAPSTSQANDVTTAFYNADGDMLQTTNPGVETSISSYDADGRTTCSEDAVNLANWLAANPSATYSYNCPSAGLVGSLPRRRDRALLVNSDRSGLPGKGRAERMQEGADTLPPGRFSVAQKSRVATPRQAAVSLCCCLTEGPTSAPQ
jgi:YD repeat-containing protein